MSARSIQWQTWDLDAEDNARLRRWFLIIGVPLLILGAIVPFLQLVGLTKGGGTLTGQRYVELLPEQPAPVAEKIEEPAPAETPEPEPEPPAPEPPQPEVVKPQPKPVTTPTPKPQPQVTQQQIVQKARETAARSGVMAFASQLQAMHSGAQAVTQTQQPLAELGAAGGGEVGGNAQAFEQAATQASGGIGNAAATGTARRAQSGTGLGTRRTTVVESPVGVGPDRSRPGQGGDALIAGRTLEEIQLTFDRNKGAFYAIFNRAMRVNPNLGAGKIVVSITIAPDGHVTDVKLVSSSFHDAELEGKVLQRVRLLNFGAKNVPTFTYPNYPINFLPP